MNLQIPKHTPIALRTAWCDPGRQTASAPNRWKRWTAGCPLQMEVGQKLSYSDQTQLIRTAKTSRTRLDTSHDLEMTQKVIKQVSPKISKNQLFR